jgi:AraC-like DNA-binding protein
LISRKYYTKQPLNKFIDYIYYYSGYNPNHVINRFLPDGEVQLIFDLTDYPKFIYDNEILNEIQSCKNVWFSGFRTKPITIPSGKDSEMLIVQFQKGMASSFLREPLNNLLDIVVDAELLFNSQIISLRNQLVDNSKDLMKMFELVENKLIKYLLPNNKLNEFINKSVSTILTNPSQISIKEIVDQSGYSHKHICKIFKENIGVTPKTLLKIIRFQKAISQIEMYKTIDWLSVCFECGFYDQSHFIADFKKFSGFTPKEYHLLKGDILNYVPIR